MCSELVEREGSRQLAGAAVRVGPLARAEGCRLGIYLFELESSGAPGANQWVHQGGEVRGSRGSQRGSRDNEKGPSQLGRGPLSLARSEGLEPPTF